MNQQEWLEALARFRDEGRSCCQVVVTGVKGSAPREVGARMIVADGKLAWGTIGGGQLEHLAIQRACELLEAGGAATVTETVPLSEKAGQCCGGEVSLFLESFSWTRRRLVIFGCGHVAQAIAGLADYMGLDVQLIDSRSAEDVEPPLPEPRPYEVLFIDAPEEEVDSIPADSLLLVMTHSHSIDQDVIARALRRGTFPYIGLIGSDRKWIRFKQRLEQRGATAEQLASVTCPIGLSKGSKEPRKIALSVAAEIVEVAERLAVGKGA
ncbi:xanthine dehydrogenase accessory protein XdhC [bacterium]|nr:xanthine dehydrogenase accessory protein XdhC [Planctomycetota bacterium]MDB4561788.1 xanthine dehydrogenase accessory protein XdhC [bacterium]MDB4736211.1 xanthine dehydrogenase accessory protein XdhC [Planctomycetota bacterium]